jgi:hypothetical protein
MGPRPPADPCKRVSVRVCHIALQTSVCASQCVCASSTRNMLTLAQARPKNLHVSCFLSLVSEYTYPRKHTQTNWSYPIRINHALHTHTYYVHMPLLSTSARIRASTQLLLIRLQFRRRVFERSLYIYIYIYTYIYIYISNQE